MGESVNAALGLLFLVGFFGFVFYALRCRVCGYWWTAVGGRCPRCERGGAPPPRREVLRTIGLLLGALFWPITLSVLAVREWGWQGAWDGFLRLLWVALIVAAVAFVLMFLIVALIRGIPLAWQELVR